MCRKLAAAVAVACFVPASTLEWAGGGDWIAPIVSLVAGAIMAVIGLLRVGRRIDDVRATHAERGYSKSRPQSGPCVFHGIGSRHCRDRAFVAAPRADCGARSERHGATGAA